MESKNKYIIKEILSYYNNKKYYKMKIRAK